MESAERRSSDGAGSGPVGVVEGGDPSEARSVVDETCVCERDAELPVLLAARGGLRHPEVVGLEAPADDGGLRRFADHGHEPTTPPA